MDQNELKVYYNQLFPFKRMFKWLSYGLDIDSEESKDFFKRREFCFVSDDLFSRYRSFDNLSDFTNQIVYNAPQRIEIGAVFNIQPSKKETVNVFVPIERELVFDIDLTDYDDVRKCCSQTKICIKCWCFVIYAIKVIDTALREDFGFKHLLWVFSGRRGVHCWVCDRRARKLNDEQRASVASYLKLPRPPQGSVGWPLHPSVTRAFTICEPFFHKLLEEDGLLDGEENWKKILDLIPESGKFLRETLHKEWSAEKERHSGRDRWDQFFNFVHGRNRSTITPQLKALPYDILFSYTYPRIDTAVSIHMNHLLKSPFVVHPKTGNVCVPINPLSDTDFNPMKTPTVPLLLEELNQKKPCSLDPYIDFFSRKFLQPMLIKERKTDSDTSLDW